MAARTKSKVTPKFETIYKAKNWPAYRLSESVMFDEDAADAWNAPASPD